MLSEARYVVSYSTKRMISHQRISHHRWGVGNVFTITGRINCELSLVGHKINYFCPKILPLCNYEEEWLLL